MKKILLITSCLATAFLMGCGSSSSSSSSNGEEFDCSLSEDGVKVFTPKGGEVFKRGDSVEVTFVAKYKNAGGYLDPENIQVSDKAFVQIEAYNAGKIRGKSETFTVKE